MTNLHTALHDSAAFVENGEQGDARELFATWLLCAVAAYDAQQDDRFSLDRRSIVDTATEAPRLVEHLLVLPDGASTAEDRIVSEIRSKLQDMPGGKGKELVVFIKGLGTLWFATRVAERLPKQVPFDAVWVITLQPSRKGEYTYGISHLDLSTEHCPVWFITVSRRFDRWKVEQIN